MKDTFSGILLAGGKSTRMGTDKTALQWNTMTLLEWQAQKLRAAGASEILLCGKSECTIPNVRCVPDILPDRGPLGGLYSGMMAAQYPTIMVLSTDVPLLPIETLRMLLCKHASDITLLRHNDQIEPLIGVYNRDLSPAVFPLISKHSASVRSLLELCDWSTIDYHGDPELLCNCNTPAEYQRALDLAEQHRLYP